MVLLIGVLANQNYAIAGLVPLFPTQRSSLPFIFIASERGIEPCARPSFHAVVDSSLFLSLSAVTVVFSPWIMRLPLAPAGARAKWRCWVLCAWLLILDWSRFH